MIKIKNIWRHSFLGKLFRDDKPFALSLSVVLGIYLIIHIVRLEVFPLYMFAMYSLPEKAPTDYTVYRIYGENALIDVSDLNFRSYTYLMNSIAQYDGILSNGMMHPETRPIDKMGVKLPLSPSVIHALKSPHSYKKDRLKEMFGEWLITFFNTEYRTIKIEKETYSWVGQKPLIKDKTIIYELD